MGRFSVDSDTVEYQPCCPLIRIIYGMVVIPTTHIFKSPYELTPLNIQGIYVY